MTPPETPPSTETQQASFAAPLGSAIKFMIQEKIGDEEWRERYAMPTAEDVMARVVELRKRTPPHPLMKYRGIIRITSDHLLPNDKLSHGPTP